MKLLFFSLSLLFSFSSLAEYRVYQYVVKNKIAVIDSPKSHLVTSTLDPVSYLSYHGGQSILSVDLLRTWMCPGNTSFQEICSGPYEELANGTKL